MPKIKYVPFIHKWQFVFLLALILRLINLNQSFWLDEAITAIVARDYSYLDIVTKFGIHDFHPPLYYFGTKAWSSLFGNNEISLRLVSVFFSLGTGYIIYLMAGVLAASLFLFNPLIVYYSQEARMYMMATFFLTFVFYKLKQQKYIYSSVLLILSFYTFYGSVFMILGFLAYFFIKKNYKAVKAIIIGSLIAGASLLPLIYTQWQSSKIATSMVVNWKSVLGTASLKNLLLIFLKFGTGRISFEPKAWYYVLGLVWTVIVWQKINWKSTKTYLLAVPLVLGFILSIFSPLFSYFRFLYLIPFWTLVFFNKKTNLSYKHLVVFGFVVWSLLYVLNSTFHREDWQSLSKSLNKNTPVYGITSSLVPINYYRPDIKVVDLRDFENAPKKITVLPYSTEIYGLDYRKLLENNNYSITKETSFRQLSLEKWRKIE